MKEFKAGDKVLVEATVQESPRMGILPVSFSGNMPDFHVYVMLGIAHHDSPFAHGQEVEAKDEKSSGWRKCLYGALIDGEHYCYAPGETKILYRWDHVRALSKTRTFELDEGLINRIKQRQTDKQRHSKSLLNTLCKAIAEQCEGE